MKIKITKIDFYKAILISLVEKEEYELAAKIRDTIKDLENPDEYYEIEIE